MKNLIYTGAFRFPDKDAASQRVLGIAKVLKQININTIFCGWENSPKKEDLDKDGLYRYEGFEYYSQNELDLKSKNIFQKVYRFLVLGSKTINWLKRNLKNYEVEYVIIYNANSYFIYRMLLLSKKFKFKLICDCTEWQEGDHLPGGKFGIVNWDNNVRMKLIYPKIKNIIVISSYLEMYLQKKGCNTIIVPPLIDFSQNKWKNLSNNNKLQSLSKTIKLIYAGNPGKKDILESIFEALAVINKDFIQIEFQVLGIEKELFNSQIFSGSEEIPNYIICMGSVPQSEVPKYYQQCDFSILLRENKRYANAGFPTKLVESLASGTPIITNKTSDIQRYIINGENGFLLNDIKEQTLLKGFEKILSLSKYDISIMSESAKKSSLQSFNTNSFSHLLEDYLLHLK